MEQRTIYTFDELPEEAKKKAIEAFYDINVHYEWWDYTYEWFITLAKKIGVNVDPDKIFFSGFYHQGQGSCFSGNIKLDVLLEEIQKEDIFEGEYKEGETPWPIPNFKDINHWLIKGIRENIVEPPTIYISGNDRYFNVNISLDIPDYEDCPILEEEATKFEEPLQELIDDMNHWLFETLQKEYEYLASEEAIIESIKANDYRFTIDGKQWTD